MEKELSLNGMRLVYDETGPENGNPVIIMHGWGCDHTTVQSITNILAKDYKVYSIDLPGHGKSDEPTGTWGVNDFTLMLEKFIRRLDIRKPALIGHSFGGRVSIMFASRNPVSKIVLVDSAGIKPKRSLKYYLKVYSFKGGKKLLPLLFGKKIGNRLLNKWRGKWGSADYRNSSPIMRAVMSKCVNEDLKSYMPKIKAPTLLVWGEEDTATPLKDAKIMEKLIPDSGLVSFAGCGHYSFLDNPGGFKSVIRSFFNIK